MSKLSRTFYKVTKTVSKHAPLMLTGAGIVGLGATAWFSYKASKNVDAILTEKEEYDQAHQDLADAIHDKEVAFESERVTGTRMSTSEVEDLDLDILSAQETLDALTPMERKEFLKRMSAAVALPVITGIASVACITASYYMLNNRLLNTAAALATSVAENEYRRRRTEEAYGQEGIDKVYGAPVSKEKVTTQNAKGKDVESEEDIMETVASLHGAWFKNSEEYVEDDHDYNLQWIDSIEHQLEDRLFQRGYITLNEVYHKLGFPKTRGGAVVGWTAGSGFNLATECPIIFNKDTGKREPQIYVKWSTPQDILNSIEFDGRYAQS